jgi:peroxiredoxin
MNVLAAIRLVTLLAIMVLALIPQGVSAQEAQVNATAQLDIEKLIAKDTDGQQIGFKDFLGADGSLVCFAFLYPDCPMSQRYGAVLDSLQEEYKDRGVRIVGIICEWDSPEQIETYKREYALDYPVYTDIDFQLVKLMDISVTPEVVLVNSKGQIHYQGRIDDRYYERGVKTPGEPSPELRNAIDDVLANRPVRESKTEPAGCPIDRPDPVKPTENVSGQISFYKDVLPFLHANCQKCHSPSNAGPFSLMSYEDATDWLEMGIEEIEARRMPPAQIETETSLQGPKKPSDAEIKMLKDWIAAGKPQGNPQDAPALAPIPNYGEFEPELGPPDLILEQPRPTHLGATGSDVYTHLIFNWNNPEDIRIRAIQFLPSNRKIVHHALIGHVPHEIALDAANNISAPKTDNQDDQIPGFYDPHKLGFRTPAPRSDGYPRIAFLCGYIPGFRSVKSPEDTTILVPSGSDVVVQMHYSRSGKPEEDSSRVGIWFDRDSQNGNSKAKRNLQMIYLSGDFAVIPPGAKDFRVTANYTLPHDADLVLCAPHVHQLARWIEIVLHEPNNPKPRLLVRVPRWDFNWQAAYYALPPVSIPAGTRIEATASYDNTTDNPMNPFNPPHPAWHAENSSDEMLLPMLSFSSSEILDPGQHTFGEFLAKLARARFVRRLVEHHYKYIANPDGTVSKSPTFNPDTDE